MEVPARLAAKFNLRSPLKVQTGIISLVAQHPNSLNFDKSIFHENELKYFASLEFDKRRRDYYLGRLAAKLGIGEYFEAAAIAPNQIEIASGFLSQPIIQSGILTCSQPIDITIAHSSGLAGAIIFPMDLPMGLDMELATYLNEQMLKEELKSLFKIEIPRILDSVKGTLIWSLMESLAKAIKCGFKTSLDVYQVSALNVTADGMIECQYAHFPQFRGLAWVYKDYVLAMAVPQRISLDLRAEDLTPFFNLISLATNLRDTENLLPVAA